MTRQLVLAISGPIARRLFIGQIDEQALVINLEGKGFVAVVGCGHQTVPKLLDRLERSFDEPIYGIVDDLHYPVLEGRFQMFGERFYRVEVGTTVEWGKNQIITKKRPFIQVASNSNRYLSPKHRRDRCFY